MSDSKPEQAQNGKIEIEGANLLGVLKAASALIDESVPFDVADPLSDIIVSAAEATKKYELLQKNAMGGRQSISPEDEGFEEAMNKIAKANQKVFVIEAAPIKKDSLKGVKISPSSLGVLKSVGLVI